jgi:hypothetical protein
MARAGELAARVRPPVELLLRLRRHGRAC